MLCSEDTWGDTCLRRWGGRKAHAHFSFSSAEKTAKCNLSYKVIVSFAYIFPGCFLRLVCIWWACGQWGGRLGQGVWGYSSSAGALWPLGSQSGPHQDFTGLETHEGPVCSGRTGGHWLWETMWGVEVGRQLHFLIYFPSYLLFLWAVYSIH